MPKDSKPLLDTHPHLAKYAVDPDTMKLSKGSKEEVWWYCDDGHKYPAMVYNKVAGKGCVFCSSGKDLCALAHRDPETAYKVILERRELRSSNSKQTKTEKHCSRCGELKHLKDFYTAKQTRDGKKAYCRECGKADSLRWVEDNTEQNRERARQWYMENPDKGIQRAIDWGNRNPEKQRAYKTKYHENNPEVGRAATQRRRARIRGGRTEKFLDTEIFERDNWMCGICGEKIDSKVKAPHRLAASIDHIYPIARGGNHTRDNVQASHQGCNSKKSDRLPGQVGRTKRPKYKNQ